MRYIVVILVFILFASCKPIKPTTERVEYPCDEWSECKDNQRSRTCGEYIETEYCGID